MLLPSVGHLFWVQHGDTAGGVSLEAGKMKVGGLLETADGKWRRLTAITPVANEETVYNFTVDKDHDYFVGETGFLVHNEQGCNCLFRGDNRGPGVIFNEGFAPRDKEIQEIDRWIDRALDAGHPDLGGSPSPYCHLAEKVVIWCESKPDLIAYQPNLALHR